MIGLVDELLQKVEHSDVNDENKDLLSKALTYCSVSMDLDQSPESLDNINALIQDKIKNIYKERSNLPKDPCSFIKRQILANALITLDKNFLGYGLSNNS